MGISMKNQDVKKIPPNPPLYERGKRCTNSAALRNYVRGRVNSRAFTLTPAADFSRAEALRCGISSRSIDSKSDNCSN